jgi:hypothetical protein
VGGFYFVRSGSGCYELCRPQVLITELTGGNRSFAAAYLSPFSRALTIRVKKP